MAGADPAGRGLKHPFGTLKIRMGAAHFFMQRLPTVATEALHVLAYNLTPSAALYGIQGARDIRRQARERFLIPA
jgi:hypothetical protein